MRIVASLVVAVLVCAAKVAHADGPDDARAVPQDPSPLAPVQAVAAGAGVMFASAAAGITIVGADRHRDGKDFAFIGASTGMVLAPILAHGIVGEWERGLWFAIPGAAGALGSLAVIQAYPDIIRRGPPIMQYAISGTLTLSIFGNTLGILDALFAGSRRAKRDGAQGLRHSLTFAPLFGGGTAGGMLTGTL